MLAIIMKENFENYFEALRHFVYFGRIIRVCLDNLKTRFEVNEFCAFEFKIFPSSKNFQITFLTLSLNFCYLTNIWVWNLCFKIMLNLKYVTILFLTNSNIKTCV